jgi:hypothetical protein
VTNKWQKYVNEIDFKLSKDSAQKKLDSWSQEDYEAADRLFELIKNNTEFANFIKIGEDKALDSIIVNLIFSEKTNNYPYMAQLSFLFSLFKAAKETTSQFSSPAFNWFPDEIKTKLTSSLAIEDIEQMNKRLKNVRNQIIEDVLRTIVFTLDDFGSDFPTPFALIEINKNGEVTENERLIQNIHDSYEDMLCSRIFKLD